jgi:UDP-2,4-diacetamido-2,4,6-trideoxy-beta-L-altropyranose hydrolase
MRCLSLAQAWMARGGSASVLGVFDSPAINERICQFGVEQIGLRETRPTLGQASEVVRWLGESPPNSWIILDGYAYDVAYLETCAATGRLMVIDDNRHLPAYSAAFVLNHSLSAEHLSYRFTTPAIRLFGPRYAMLREEFLEHRPRTPAIRERVHRIVVTMGGGDPDNVTGELLQTLATQPGPFDIQVLVGPANQNRAAVESVARTSPHRCRVLHSPRAIASIFAEADLAISGAGTTSWELACLGVPMVLLAVADNQQASATDIAAAGAAVVATRSSLPEALRLMLGSRDLRSRLASAAHAMVDGRGAERVTTELSYPWLSLRPAGPADKAILFKWVNQPEIRKNAFHSKPIDAPTHELWFADTLANAARLLLVAETWEGTPCGQIRFDIVGRRATVTVALDQCFAGRGLGRSLIYRGCRYLFDRRPEVDFVDAFIKLANTRSLDAFAAIGFVRGGEREVAGSRAVLATLTREEHQ